MGAAGEERGERRRRRGRPDLTVSPGRRLHAVLDGTAEILIAGQGGRRPASGGHQKAGRATFY